MSLFQTIATTGSHLLPFEGVIAVQRRLVRIDAIRRLIYGTELAKLDRLLDMLGVDDPDAVEAARRERCLATWANRSRRRFVTLSPDRLGKSLKLAPDIEGRLRQGALLVASHFGSPFLTILALAPFRLDAVWVVGSPGWEVFATNGARILNVNDEPPTRIMLESLAMLRRGGIVYLAGDLSGSGFAHLALGSGVPATPIFSRIDQDGTIFTWLDPPLEVPDAVDRRAQIAALEGAYADRIDAIFARYPGNVPPLVIERYLKYGGFQPRGVTSC